MLLDQASRTLHLPYLLDQDVRWNIISGSVDDRTPEEQAGTTHLRGAGLNVRSLSSGTNPNPNPNPHPHPHPKPHPHPHPHPHPNPYQVRSLSSGNGISASGDVSGPLDASPHDASQPEAEQSI